MTETEVGYLYHRDKTSNLLAIARSPPPWPANRKRAYVEWARRPDVVVAALLHDAVEDQDVTNAEIADLFGSTVASLVAELTDDKILPKQGAQG